MSTRVELGLVALVVALAALLRLLWLDAIPAGWHHDEALMGIMASEVYRGVQRPIFFTGFLGQEPLYIYMSAGLMWLMGGNQDILPLRITSALVGIATVIVAHLLGRELFGRRVGLIGASLLAFSFWQVMLSRDGYRVITQPLLEGLTVLLLLRAARHNSIRYYTAAGVALGGTFYTYLGARLFPGVLVLFAIWWLIARGLPTARARIGIALFCVVAGLVTAPLGLFFAANPGAFSARIDQVFVFQPGATDLDPVLALVQNIAKLLATFTVYGESLWRYNIDGRPIFVGAAAPLFYIGFVVAIINVLRSKPVVRGHQAASALIIAWFVAMLAPSFLSVDVGGYTFRSMGLVPILYLIPALGFVSLWDWTVANVPRSWWLGTKRSFVAVIALILVAEAGLTYRDYFDVWAKSFGGAYEDMADVVAAARVLDREARPGEEEIFVSSDYYHHANIAHLVPRVYADARWFDGNSAVVLSPGRERASLYVFPFSARPPELDRYLPPEAVVERSFFENGAEKLVAYRLTPLQVDAAVETILDDPSLTKLRVNLGDQIELLGYRTDRRVEQGGNLEVTAVWRVLKNAPPQELVVFAHLLDTQGTMWAQFDTSAYPAAEWQAGDILVGRYLLKVSNLVVPGKYSVVMGVYDRGTQARVPIVGGAQTGDSVRVENVKVAGRGPADITPTRPVGKRLGEVVELLGFDLPQLGRQVAPPSLTLNLYWEAKSIPPEDYTVFVQLLDSEGRLVAQSDSQPLGGSFPTSYWEPGERILDQHALKLGDNLPSGRYRLITGMYLLSTGKRLAAEGALDYIALTDIELPR